jgi:hypothetical protein
MKDTAKLLAQVQDLVDIFKRYLIIITVAVFALLAGYLVLTATQLANEPPNAAAIEQQSKKVTRPKVDEKIVNTILSLEDRNVQVKAIFKNARQNPFNE